jgi:hypothetical protein
MLMLLEEAQLIAENINLRRATEREIPADLTVRLCELMDILVDMNKS